MALVADRKVTLYIPADHHRVLTSCLAAHGEKMSPLALRLLDEWCRVRQSGGDTAQPNRQNQYQDTTAVAEHQALDLVLAGSDRTARVVLLAMLHLLAPAAFHAEETETNEATTADDLAARIAAATRFLDEAARTGGTGTAAGGTIPGRPGMRRRG